jgi:hypothetical protein
MKKFILILFLVGFTYGYGLDSLSYNLHFVDGLGDKNNSLHFGLHKDASDTIDFHLGEVDAPQFPPPNKLYAVFLVTDSTDLEVFHTYYDFRPIPDVQKFKKYYKLRLYNLTTPYTMSWPKLNKYIDSAFIRDLFTGNIVNIDMMTAQSHYFENFSQNQFNIVVYYNKSLVSVRNDSENIENELIYPNPTNDFINLKNVNNQYLRFDIVNELGINVQSGELINDNVIKVEKLTTGTYFLLLYDEFGNNKVMRFIKI